MNDSQTVQSSANETAPTSLRPATSKHILEELAPPDHKPTPQSNSRRIGSAAVLCGLVLSLGGCKEKTDTQAPPPPTVRTAPAASSSTAQDLVLSGSLEADVSVAVAFHTLGTIQKVLVSEGQVVREGQLLANLDGGMQRDQVAAAEAKVHQAEDAWKRLEPMHRNATIPEIKWVEVEADREQARSMASQAKRALDDATLRAPISGIVAKRSIEPGEQAPIGLPAFTIVQTGTMLATVAVAEKDVARLKVGAPAQITIAAAGQKLSGKVREIGIAADPLSRTYKVKVALPNPGGILRVGMVSDVRFKIPGRQPSLVVPTAAVLVDEKDNRFVWIEKSGKVARRLVKVSGFLQEGTAIDSGLAAGETVVVSGTPMLSEGIAVRIGN
jgi:membrane fusion protein, multidrug efflux system